MKKKQNLAKLWQQIVEDYEQIRREQEEEWISLSQEELIKLTEDLLLLIHEVEKYEKGLQDERVDSPSQGDSE